MSNTLNSARLVCSLCASTLLIACTQEEATPSAVAVTEPYISTIVGSALVDIENTFSKKRSPLLFDSGETAEDCNRYFALMDSSTPAETKDNQLAAQDYVICDTVKALAKVQHADFTGLGISNPGAMLAGRVALDSLPSSVFQQIRDKNSTMSIQLEDYLRVNKYSAIAEADDWYYELTVHAVADLNGDGAEDWLVWLTDKAKNGDHSVKAAYLASSVPENASIELKPLRK